MIDEVDDRGFYILDRHAAVTIVLDNVTGSFMTGVIPNQVLELGFRRVDENTVLPKNCLVEVGNIELAYDDVYGAGGSVFAKRASISFLPKDREK